MCGLEEGGRACPHHAGSLSETGDEGTNTGKRCLDGQGASVHSDGHFYTWACFRTSHVPIPSRKEFLNALA